MAPSTDAEVLALFCRFLSYFEMLFAMIKTRQEDLKKPGFYKDYIVCFSLWPNVAEAISVILTELRTTPI